MSQPLRLRSLRAFVFRHLLEKPVTTSFGAMRDRPMAFVRAEDDEGVVGWGEIWCNFPTVVRNNSSRAQIGVRLQTWADSDMMGACCSWREQWSESVRTS